MQPLDKIYVSGQFDQQLEKDTLSKINETFNQIKIGSEFEFMFFKNIKKEDDVMFSEHHNNMLNYIKALEHKTGVKFTVSNTLDVNYSTEKVTYRVTITGMESINKYIKMFHERQNHIIFSLLVDLVSSDNSITMMKKSRNSKNAIDINEFNMRLRLAEESNVTKDDVKLLSKLSNTDISKIMFRFKQRVSFSVEDNKDVSINIDLTDVKSSKVMNDIEMMVSSYELELELVAKKDKLPKSYLDMMFKEITFILKMIQGSHYIINNATQYEVLNEYANLLGIGKDTTSLAGRKPVSLEVQHVVDQLPDKYAVTDKADGDRFFLIIYRNVVFLISDLLKVRNTGIVINNKKYNDSLLDGELIFIRSARRFVYMCFDCLYFSNQDIREIALLNERFKYADEIISECFILKGQKGHKMKDYDGKFDMGNILKYYDDDINNYMSSLNYDIGVEKMYPLIRRKYFISALGGMSNEIFKYSMLVWDKYTKSKGVHCPYILDGLVYQPLNQKYVTSIAESKFLDYKWKPAEKNSIDFYVEFERDKKSGKIVTVFDNSNVNVDDDTVGELMNKPYKILNLYVGKSTREGEQPILFEPERDSVRNVAYIYINKGHVKDIEGNIIQDKTVVEFYYNNDVNISDKHRWTPIRTRYDKTEHVRRFKKKYGNYVDIANIVWRSIKNPFTMNDVALLSKDELYNKHIGILRGKIDHSIILSDKNENEYNLIKKYLGKPMRNFNNWVKSVLMYTYINSMYEQDERQLSAMDIGCGRGGDIMRFYYGKVNFCINIDIDVNALISPVDGAISRYNQMKKTHPGFPSMNFIQADAGVRFDFESQNSSLGGMSSLNKDLILKFFDKVVQVDRMSCQLTIHNFLVNDVRWSNFCGNVERFLKPGGYFMATAFDADKIVEILEEKKNYAVYYINEKGEQKVLFDIVKKYDGVKKNTVIGTGVAIDYHNSLEYQEGTYVTEYLVQIKFIEKEFLEKCGLELVDTEMFSNLYTMHKDYFNDVYKYEDNEKTRKFLNDAASYYSDKSEIGNACKKLTELMRYFVFRKRDDFEVAKKKK